MQAGGPGAARFESVSDGHEQAALNSRRRGNERTRRVRTF